MSHKPNNLSPATVTIAGTVATNEQLQGLATAQTDSHITPIFDKQEVLDNMALASTLADVVTLGSNVIATQLKRDDYVAMDNAIADAEANLFLTDPEAYDTYAQNPSVNTLLSLEFNTALASDPTLQSEYDKYKAGLKEGEQDAFMTDYINSGKSFGTLSSQEAQWHITELSYGPGSSFDMATQALRGAASALAMGNTDQALVNLTQPYIANRIGQYFDDPNNTNEAGRALAHAALGAAEAILSGNDALSTAAGAVTGEVIAQIVIEQLYNGKNPDELTLQERENVRAIATLASGLIGAATGGSFEDSAASAAAGYNSAVNNMLEVQAQALAANYRATGINMIAFQQNSNDPNSWQVQDPLGAGYERAYGENAGQYYSGDAKRLFDNAMEVGSYALGGAKIFINGVEKLGYAWSVQKAAGVTGGVMGGGFGSIFNSADFKVLDWVSPSYQIEKFLESHDPTNRQQ